MIDQFTSDQFQQVLTDAGLNWDNLGYIGGELCYNIRLDDKSGIRIRSSIKANGQSASVGADSIRAYLVCNGQGLIGKHTIQEEQWITRVPGWEIRLIEKIDLLRLTRQALGNCKKCGMPLAIYRSGAKAKHPNQIYTKCAICNSFDHFVYPRELERLENIATQIPMQLSEKQLKAIELAAPDFIPTSDAIIKDSIPTDGFGMGILKRNNLAADLIALAEKDEDGFGNTSDTPVLTQKEFKPSIYQEAIRDFVLDDSRALRVEAYAGSGKTSTNAFVCRALTQDSRKVKMMVFSKANQLDMQAKIPDWIPATTTHSAGFSDIRRVYRNVKVDERKTLNLFKQYCQFDYDLRDNYPAIAKLVSLCKNTLSDPLDATLDELCDRYDIQVNGSRGAVYDAVANLLTKSAEQTNVIDFDDMLWFPASGKVGVEKCDLLFVDEYQDNNKAQEQYYLKTQARIIYVGDAKQAIYGFRGAQIGAMDSMQKLLSAEQLPLPISYRCAKNIIILAQTLVPQIQFRPDAPDGTVSHQGKLSMVKPGDMVLCRNNAPLVKPCFELIRNGVKATIKGRDIGTNLMNLVKKVEKRQASFSFMDMLRNVQDYTDSESAKLDLQHRESQAASLRDQCETIMALSENCNSMGDLENRVKTIFSDDVQGVSFGTIHKNKGGESDRVFIIKPELLTPQKYDTQSWQLEQLQNLTYVAYTRAKQELYFVHS